MSSLIQAAPEGEKWFNTNAGFERSSARAPEGTHKREITSSGRRNCF